MEDFEEFWKNSAEVLNDELRRCEIVDITSYHSRKIQKMERLMNENVSTIENIFYRTAVFNTYSEYNIGEVFEEKTFQSCCTDKYDREYGSFEIKIIVPKGSPLIIIDTTVILPPGDYKILSLNSSSCELKLKKAKKYFK